MKAAMELGARTFSAADQTAFAALSGDRNPMHMDAAAARRTQMGAPVVHGIHGMLWALDMACAAEPLAISGLKVNFAGPIYLGEAATARLGQRSESQLRVGVEVDGAAATSIVLSLGPPEAASAPLTDTRPEAADWPAVPRDLCLSEMANQSGAIQFARSAEAAQAEFPHLSRAIGAERVNALISLSRLVGMICPGLHSIFSGF
ncbi:MAG: MaoC family dehydratase, partial [Proteobacteria bacterium]|nr:MaoC family dehydratase [Pseudomonadota bacterium]